MPIGLPFLTDDLLGTRSMVKEPPKQEGDKELSRLEEEALKEHLAYAQDLVPLNQPGALEKRGYLDEQGNATRLGEDYLMLEDQGLFDANGQLTAKGQAFGIDPIDALDPKNLDTFAIRDKAGLNEQPDGPGVMDSAWNLGKGLLKGAHRLARSAKLDYVYNPMFLLNGFDSKTQQAEKEAEDTINNQEAFKQAIAGGAQLMSGAVTMADKALSAFTPGDMDYYAAKQRGAKFTQDLEDLSTGQLYGNLIDSQQVVQALDQSNQQAQQALGPERSAQVKAEGGMAGMILDPANIATMGVGGLVGSAEKLPMIASMSAKVEQSVLAAGRAEELAAGVAKAKSIADKTSRAAAIADQQAKNLEAMGRASKAAPFRDFASRMTATAEETAGKIPTLEAQAQDAAIHSQKLAEASGGAQKVLQTIDQLKEVGRQVRAAPARAMAPVLESIGEGLIKTDTVLRKAIEKIGPTRALIGAIGLGSTEHALLPVLATTAAGPLVRGVGNFTRVLGKQLMESRGTVPFWQKVAQDSTATPLMRSLASRIDDLTLGGKAVVPLRVAAKAATGAAAAAPVNLAFSAVANGGNLDSNTITQALAQSLVFGGGSALGGAIVKGGIHDLRAKAVGDEINFRKTLSPEETTRFQRMGGGPRKNLAIYAGSFPELKFKLTAEGPSSYDRTTNTAVINTKAGDWIRPLVAHEVNHHIQIKGQMEEGIKAMLVGDEVSGGLLRTKDGALDPNFKQAMDAYNGRMKASKLAPLSVEDFAIEYFNEATVNDLLDTTESGKLQRMAGRSDLERKVRSISRATIARAPILENLFYGSGGARDSGGRMVQGNGLLAGGVRELPGAKKMLREILERDAGRRRQNSSVTATTTEVPKIVIEKGDMPALESVFSVVETDQAGKPILDENGEPRTITQETDKKRSTAGKSVIDAQKNKIDAGIVPAPGEIVPTGKGGFEGTHLPEDALAIIAKEGKLNDLQVQNLAMFNEASKALTGETFSVINHKATGRDEFNRNIKYGSFGGDVREVVPLGIKINKEGAISIQLLEVNQLAKNIEKRAGSARGKSLYGGDYAKIMADCEAVMELHRKGEKTDSYFSQKYGPKGPDHKNFINTVLDVDNATQRDKNPLFAEDEVKGRSVFKSYRLDRISKATRLKGRTSLPFVYESVKLNHFPNGVPEGRGGGMPTPPKMKWLDIPHRATGSSKYGEALIGDAWLKFRVSDHANRTQQSTIRSSEAQFDGIRAKNLISERGLDLPDWIPGKVNIVGDSLSPIKAKSLMKSVAHALPPESALWIDHPELGRLGYETTVEKQRFRIDDGEIVYPWEATVEDPDGETAFKGEIGRTDRNGNWIPPNK